MTSHQSLAEEEASWIFVRVLTKSYPTMLPRAFDEQEPRQTTVAMPVIANPDANALVQFQQIMAMNQVLVTTKRPLDLDERDDLPLHQEDTDTISDTPVFASGKKVKSTATSGPGRVKLRNFLCMHPGCGKAFPDNAHLRDHMFVHNRVKSVACTICHKKFARPSSLKSHLKLHANHNPSPAPSSSSSSSSAVTKAKIRIMPPPVVAPVATNIVGPVVIPMIQPKGRKEPHCMNCQHLHRTIQAQKEIIQQLQIQMLQSQGAVKEGRDTRD